VAEKKENLKGMARKTQSKAIMKNHFANACRYEYRFWEMAYNLNG
jgi:thiaminase